MNVPLRRSGFRTFGFTLIELMVVIVLIAVMTALILPEMKGTYEEALLRSEARKVIEAFSLAHSRAITLHQAQRVRLANGRYFIEKTAPDTREGRGPGSATEFPGSAGALDTRIAIGSGPASGDAADPGEPRTRTGAVEDPENAGHGLTVFFYPDGTAKAPEIRLRDRQGFRLALRIHPITSRVHIVELEHE